MTFEQLRALQAVVIEGSVRAASRKIFKTAPAVSSLIRKLEGEVGLQLLSREGYRPTLTDEGRIFYEKSKLVLDRMNELKAIGLRLAQREEALVKIAINSVCPLKLLLKHIHRIARHHPDTQLNVSTENMGGAMERLHEAEVDMAITTEANLDASVMEALAIVTVPIVPVVHRDHALAMESRMIPRDLIRNHTQVIVSDSSAHSEQSLDIVEGGRQCRVTEMSAKKDLIMAGLGWGGLPHHFVAAELQRGVLVQVYPEGFPVRQSVQYLIRRTDHPLGVVSQAIWEGLQDLQSLSASLVD